MREVTGIPVRREIFEIAARPAGEALRLLVFGGSQGARVFNEVMPKIAGRLLEPVPGLTILHQAGPKQAGVYAKRRIGGAGLIRGGGRWRLFWTICRARFAEADVILCRSGASTVAELAAAGRAAVLVPFPGAADDHQTKNAEVFERAGAAVLRVQAADELMEGFLLSDLSGLLLNAELRMQMGERARGLAHAGAVQEIGEMAVSLVKQVGGLG